jgi:hypothetical protein
MTISIAEAMPRERAHGESRTGVVVTPLRLHAEPVPRPVSSLTHVSTK